MMFDPRKVSIRTRIGILTIFFWIGLLIGIWHLWRTGRTEALGVCVRFGVIMTLFWLAWPELIQLPRWIFVTIPVAIIVAVWRPILLIYIIPMFLVVWFFSGGWKQFW